MILKMTKVTIHSQKWAAPSRLTESIIATQSVQLITGFMRLGKFKLCPLFSSSLGTETHNGLAGGDQLYNHPCVSHYAPLGCILSGHVHIDFTALYVSLPMWSISNPSDQLARVLAVLLPLRVPLELFSQLIYRRWPEDWRCRGPAAATR
jgi:hypothetical protein